ncbi:uncharacterized protein LY79DRAFT_660981 [Colletotrichum navitas]|uniref:Nudix hydrolase domain-containing protein n=1 Tax=Colletotrichum navitas TaxID=681940 RepID=A0AAD8PUX0_9PEZI|nr:uncharacterized protein LY79DRAFT_660981 [Colletotrichum navitas]KAK1580692.1 hypothetical protein LY79DRAFT_660981 [Colletotrichum navitas]
MSFALTWAKPVKPGSVYTSRGRAICGVVALERDGRVWMVESKRDGYILPKGGWDTERDHDWIDCVEREAREEAGVIVDRASCQHLSVQDDVTWFKCRVTGHGQRTDPSLANRGPPHAFDVPTAWRWLQHGDQNKKSGMHKALRAAT